jgi:hypothetical protein
VQTLSRGRVRARGLRSFSTGPAGQRLDVSPCSGVPVPTAAGVCDPLRCSSIASRPFGSHELHHVN